MSKKQVTNIFSLLEDNSNEDVLKKKPKKKQEEEKKPELFNINVDTSNKKQISKKKVSKKKIEPAPQVVSQTPTTFIPTEIVEEIEINYEEIFDNFLVKVKSIMKEGFISAIDGFSLCETCSEFSTSNEEQKRWIDECEREIFQYFETNRKHKKNYEMSYELSHKIYKFNLKKRNKK
jgi:hypothetical protein